jgi:hypothetical protein
MATAITLTPEKSRVARRELGLSQKDVITQTGIPAYKIKQWEGRGLAIEHADLKALIDFYETNGVDFDQIEAQQRGGGVPGAASLSDGFTYSPRPGFFISNDLSSNVVDRLMTDMEASDDRIAEIIQTASTKGLFGDMSGDTEALIQELFAQLAVNHLRFRCLQGRNIIAPTRDEAKTVGDCLSQWVNGQGVFIPGALNGEADATPDDSGVASSATSDGE